MLDIDFIRSNQDVINHAIKRRAADFDLDELLRVDQKRRELITEIEKKQSQQNVQTDKMLKIILD